MMVLIVRTKFIGTPCQSSPRPFRQRTICFRLSWQSKNGFGKVWVCSVRLNNYFCRVLNFMSAQISNWTATWPRSNSLSGTTAHLQSSPFCQSTSPSLCINPTSASAFTQALNFTIFASSLPASFLNTSACSVLPHPRLLD